MTCSADSASASPSRARSSSNIMERSRSKAHPDTAARSRYPCRRGAKRNESEQPPAVHSFPEFELQLLILIVKRPRRERRIAAAHGVNVGQEGVQILHDRQLTQALVRDPFGGSLCGRLRLTLGASPTENIQANAG